MRLLAVPLLFLVCAASACSQRTEVTTRFSDDSISSSFTYVNGVLEGAFVLFHPGGQVHIECSYADGLRDGRYQSWYPNGARVASGLFERGLRVGEWSEWTEDGLPVTRGSYTAGDKDGVWILYDAAGRVEYEDNWSHGTRTERIAR